MFKTTVLIILVVGTLGYLPKQEQETLEVEMGTEGYGRKDQIEFENWMMEYGKDYDNDFTLIHRMRIYQKNKQEVKSHNFRFPHSQWAMNSFADMDNDELRHTMFMHIDINQDLPPRRQGFLSDLDIKELNNHPLLLSLREAAKTPEGLDWHDEVPEVQHQGKCGSCWAFSTTDTVIGRLVVKGKAKLGQLSKTHLLDCSKDKCAGCDGGMPAYAMQFIHDNGALAEADYRKYDGTAAQNCTLVTDKTFIGKGLLSNIVTEKNPSDEIIIAALQAGPVSALMYCNEAWFRFSSGFVDTCTYSKDSTNIHAVVITGYDSKGWIMKNSWGKDWGEQGFFRIQRTGDAGCLDKIARISYPLVK